MKLTVTGLDETIKHLNEAQKAINELDGNICNVSLDPNDPGSIEAAIKKMEADVDQRIGAYAGNPMIEPLIAGTKATFREAIVKKAAEARLKGQDDDATQN